MIKKWINDNYENLKIKTKGIVTNEPDDIFNEVIIQFLEMNTGKTSTLIKNGEADKYIMAMYKVNCFSKTSPYQREYNKYKSVEFNEHKYKEIEKNNFDISIVDLERFLEDIDIFFIHKICFKEYIYNKIEKRSYSVKKIAEESTIPNETLKKSFKQIRSELKNKKDKND